LTNSSPCSTAVVERAQKAQPIQGGDILSYTTRNGQALTLLTIGCMVLSACVTPTPQIVAKVVTQVFIALSNRVKGTVFSPTVGKLYLNDACVEDFRPLGFPTERHPTDRRPKP
jgi:hypothetical protein